MPTRCGSSRMPSSRPAGITWLAMLAAALIAHSRLLVSRSSSSPPCAASMCPAARRSTSSVVDPCHGRSSWRTISEPDPRRRPPVDLPEVVAGAVLAGRGVVGAAGAHGVAADVLADVEGDRWHQRGQLLDARGDQEVAGVRERPGQVDQAERVDHPQAQRAGAVPPAGERRHRVRHRARLAPAQPVEHEARPARDALGQHVLEHQRARRQDRPVGHRQVDDHPHVAGRAGGVRSAGRHQREPGTVHDDGGDDRHGEREAAGAGEVDLAQRQPAQDGGDAGSDQAAGAGGEPDPRRATRGCGRAHDRAATGIGVLATMPASRSSGVRPAMCASALSSSRWARTDEHSRCRSSGMT